MKKLKVALVIPTHFDINSSLNNLLKVYRYLIRSRRIEVTIFTDKKNNARYEDFKVQKIGGIDYRTGLDKILFLLGIPRFWYTDLVEKLKGYGVIESSNPEFYGFAYQSYKAAKKYKSKLVYRTSQTVEGFYLFRMSKYFIIPLVKKSYNYANSLLFTNPQAKKRAEDLGLVERDSKKSVVIGHATDTKTFRPLNMKKQDGKTILLSVGGLYKIKGHHLIMKALKKIIEKGHKNIELWIVGKGYYKNYLEKLSKRLGISDKVKFLGAKSHEELVRIYNSSSIFVLANYQEITPAVNEAMACNISVVAMECGGYDLVIPDSEHGLIAKRFDVDDMAEKTIFLMKNRSAAKAIAKKGRTHIIRNFSIEKVASRIYNSFSKKS